MPNPVDPRPAPLVVRWCGYDQGRHDDHSQALRRHGMAKSLGLLSPPQFTTTTARQRCHHFRRASAIIFHSTRVWFRGGLVCFDKRAVARGVVSSSRCTAERPRKWADVGRIWRFRGLEGAVAVPAASPLLSGTRVLRGRWASRVSRSIATRDRGLGRARLVHLARRRDRERMFLNTALDKDRHPSEKSGRCGLVSGGWADGFRGVGAVASADGLASVMSMKHEAG